MNIVLATDNNFVQHCCVAITSVLINNPHAEFYILTEGLSSENEAILFQQVKKYNGHLEICVVDSRIVSMFPMPVNAGDHITIATYYRLFVEELLPKSLSKVIYMDCDMIARKSFDDLWNIPIDDYALGAVYQPIDTSQESDKRRLLIPEERGYFNAGLLLINLDYWRKNNITNRLLEFIKFHFDLILQHDQDVLNAVLFDQTKALSYTWNYLPSFVDKDNIIYREGVGDTEIVVDPANIHFVSAPKPWEFCCNNPYKHEYYKYLSLTSYKKFKPRFEWNKFYKNVIRIKILNLICIIDVFEIRRLFKMIK